MRIQKRRHVRNVRLCKSAMIDRSIRLVRLDRYVLIDKCPVVHIEFAAGPCMSWLQGSKHRRAQVDYAEKIDFANRVCSHGCRRAP